MSIVTSITPEGDIVIAYDQLSGCPVCKEPLGELAAMAGGKLFHPECLRCSTCGTGWRQTFGGSIEKPYCAECYVQKHPPTCDGCGQPLKGNVCLEFLSKYYHPNCIKCFDCREPFKDNRFYPIDDVACCLNCYWLRRLKAT